MPLLIINSHGEVVFGITFPSLFSSTVDVLSFGEYSVVEFCFKFLPREKEVSTFLAVTTRDS